MKTSALSRVKRLYPTHSWTTPEITRANRLKWVRAVRQLGDKWLLAQPMSKSTH